MPHPNPNPNPTRLLWSLAAVLLFASFHPSATARPKIGVTVKQHEMPRPGDFWQYEQVIQEGEDEAEAFRILMTAEVEKIETDEKSGIAKFRYRYRSRVRGRVLNDMFDFIEALSSGSNQVVHYFIDPKRKAWIAEAYVPGFDKETQKPTKERRLDTRISFPAPVTAPGQILTDGKMKIKVVSINRKVKTPAGTFRCMVVEQEGPLPYGDPSKRVVTVNYSHYRVGTVRSEFFLIEDGKRIPTGTMMLQFAELHDKDGLKSHKDFALPEKAGEVDEKGPNAKKKEQKEP